MKKRFLKLGILVSVFALTINPISIYARSANGNPNTYEELTRDIVKEMQQRKTNFVINYEGDSSPIINKEYDIFSDIKKIDDYNSWSYERINTRIQKSSSITTFTFTVDYFATLEQEQYVSNELDKVLSEIITDGMTDREKLDAISDWILDLLVYDHTLVHRSTYDAIVLNEVVCQGYAMLLDLMCEKVGIRSELVLGGLNGAPDGHGWNVVRLDGKWYYIDLTNVDKPINRPYYLVTKAQLQGHNFVWDDSLINFTEHRTVFPVEDNISLRYDNENNKLIIENTGNSQVDIFYNTDIFSDWSKFSNSNGWKNSLYDGFGNTSDGRYFGYYSNNAWNLNNSLHVNANSDGVIEPIGFQDGKYTILMRVKDDSSTIYKAIDFTVNGSTSKGSTGMKDSTYYNDLFKTEVESKVVNGKILVDTKNPALVVKSYKINNGEEVVVQDKKSTYSIDPNTDGTVSLLLTVENIYNDGYGDYRTKNYTYTLDIPQVSTTPTPTVEPTAPPVTPTPTVAPTAPPVTQTPTVAPTNPPVTTTPTVAPTNPPVTTTPTVAPTNPPVTTTPTVVPTAPPVTTTPTVVPTAPPVTTTPTVVPTAPPVTPKPTVVPTAPPVTPKPTVVPTAPPVTVIPTPTPYYPILTESEIVSLADDRRQVSLYVEVLNLLNKAQHESEMDNTEDVFIIIKEAKGLMNQIKYTEMLNILKTEYLKVQMHLEEEMANEVISETLDNLSKKSLSEFLSFIETVENEDLRKSLYSEHERFTETFEKLQLSEVKGLIKKANKNPTLKVLNQIKSIISEIDDKDTQKQLNKQYVELDKKLDKKEISQAKKQLTVTKKKITKANLNKLNKAIKLVDSKKDKSSLQKEYNKLLVKFNKKA